MNKKQKAYRKAKNIYHNNTSRMDKFLEQMWKRTGREMTFAVMKQRFGMKLSEHEEQMIASLLEQKKNEILNTKS